MIPFSRGARQILDPFAKKPHAAIREPLGGDQQTMQKNEKYCQKTQNRFLKNCSYASLECCSK